MTEKEGQMSEAEFKFRLANSTEPVQKKFWDLFNRRRKERSTQGADQRKVPLEEQIDLYSQALQVGQYGNVNSTEMARKQDSHTSAEGKRPMGGSND